MRALLSLLLAVGAGAAPVTDPSGLRDLTPGRYELKLGGTLCAACLRAVALELAEYPSVEYAKPDVWGESVRVGVRGGKLLKASEIKRALSRGASLANLGAKYSVLAVRYELTPLNPAPNKPAPVKKKP